MSQGVLCRQWEVGDGQKRSGNEGRQPNKEAEKSAASTCVLHPRYTLCSYFRMSEGKGTYIGAGTYIQTDVRMYEW